MNLYLCYVFTYKKVNVNTLNHSGFSRGRKKNQQYSKIHLKLKYSS